MKIAYVRPYVGEMERVEAGSPENEFLAVADIDEIPVAVRLEIEGLSVFVDYQVTAEELAKLPNLTCITTRSAGFDHIDKEAVLARNITVCRVPHYGTRTVAEYVFALLFALSRNAYRSYTDMQRDARVTNFESYEGFDLYGKTLGVVGTGAIGRNVCSIARGLGMNVLAYDVSPDDKFAHENNFMYETLEEVLAHSDIVTLHVPSMPATHHLINQSRLALMKSGSYLINTARGEIVDTKALVAALTSGHLKGAALDVLEGEHELRDEVGLLTGGSEDMKIWETLVADHTLIDMDNVIVTPHIAFNTIEAKREITDITIANIKAFISGTPQNIVSL